MLPAFLPETELPPRPLLAALHIAPNVAVGQKEQRTKGGQTAVAVDRRQRTEHKWEIHSLSLLVLLYTAVVPSTVRVQQNTAGDCEYDIYYQVSIVPGYWYQ